MDAGQQWTWGQKQSIWCLRGEEGWGEGSRRERWTVEGDGADVAAGKHQRGRRDLQAFGLFGLWGKRRRLGLGARRQVQGLQGIRVMAGRLQEEASVFRREGRVGGQGGGPRRGGG